MPGGRCRSQRFDGRLQVVVFDLGTIKFLFSKFKQAKAASSPNKCRDVNDILEDFRVNMAAPLSLSLSLSSVFKPKSPYPLHSPILAFSTTQRRSYYLKLQPKITKSWKLCAVNDQFWLSEVENSQEIVATNGDGVSRIITGLLGIAFVGLSILTIGVIYIAVTDFLQKREGDKFEKEEAAKKKKKKSGKKSRGARGGPKGFGQKLQDDDDDFQLDS